MDKEQVPDPHLSKTGAWKNIYWRTPPSPVQASSFKHTQLVARSCCTYSLSALGGSPLLDAPTDTFWGLEQSLISSPGCCDLTHHQGLAESTADSGLPPASNETRLCLTALPIRELDTQQGQLLSHLKDLKGFSRGIESYLKWVAAPWTQSIS